MDLLHVPIEIWCSIFRLLDPIGLIAASQACQWFRQIIKPGRIHFLERLLACECQVEYGGPVPRFDSQNFKLEPAWEEEAWTRMRWACGGCMRLLPDSEFDNHSLLRLGYRKPAPGTASSRAVTSWEPSANGSLSRKWTRKNLDSIRAEEKKIRKQYAIALTSNWWIPKDTQDPLQRLMSLQDAGLKDFMHCGLEYFQCMDVEEEREIFDRAAAAIEGERTGLRRHLRRCNECRWKRGDMKVHHVPLGLRFAGPNIGTDAVPIVRSRQVHLPTALDRWFPGWPSALARGEEEGAKPPKGGPPLIYRTIRGVRHSEPWNLYMVRCRGCARWQEYRAFRDGESYHKFKPATTTAEEYRMLGDRGREQMREEIDDLICNSCFRERHGDERLARDLLRWWGRLADKEMLRLQVELMRGWDILVKQPPVLPDGRPLFDDSVDGEEEARLQSKLFWSKHDLTTWSTMLFGPADRDPLRRRHRRWLEYVKGGGYVGPEGREEYMRYWTDQYEAIDDWRLWLKRCKEEFQANPQLLLVEPDFVAGVIRKGAKLERHTDWAQKKKKKNPLSDWTSWSDKLRRITNNP